MLTAFFEGLVPAWEAGGDEALMLDRDGNVSTCNSTNFFMIKDNEVWDFESDLEPLREIRKLVMDSDGQVGLELKVVQDDEKDNSELH